MNELEAKPAVLKATIQITRAKTGKVEEYTITGTPECQSPTPQSSEQQPPTPLPLP